MNNHKRRYEAFGFYKIELTKIQMLKDSRPEGYKT